MIYYNFQGRTIYLPRGLPMRLACGDRYMDIKDTPMAHLEIWMFQYSISMESVL